MASWNDLVTELEKVNPPQDRGRWLLDRQKKALQEVSARRENRNVIFYASGYLQKPQAFSMGLPIAPEDINGFMSVMFGMDWSRGLTLILHTPGGFPGAAQTIVEYLSQKFTYIEVIIPTYAMSAGTMVSLAADKLVMGRQSQLGPIDPQMSIRGEMVSARAIVDQFEQAKKEVLANPGVAHVWAPVLQGIGPGLLQEAKNALEYGEQMVASWLARRMFQDAGDPEVEGKRVANYFNDAGHHKSHGRRIDRNEARKQGLKVEDLEDDDELQDAVLTAYHLLTIGFENTDSIKVMSSSEGRNWIKNAKAVPAMRPIGAFVHC